MNEQQAFGVFGIAETVIKQIPIQAVCAGVTGMTTGTALPSLQTYGRIVEIEFTFAGRRSFPLPAPEKWIQFQQVKSLN